MSKQPSSITGQFKAMIAFPSVAPLAENWNVVVPLLFADAANLQKIDGTYTPNNDTFNIVTGLIAKGLAPNFFILVVDGLVWFGNPGFNYMSMPVDRFACVTLLPGTQIIDGFSFYGQAGVANPMIQGQPVNFTLIFGQAAIT